MVMGELAEEGWQREAFGSYRHMPEIDKNVALPPEDKKAETKRKTATRARSAASKKKAAAPNPAAGFIRALNFIAPAQKAQGTPYQTHCILAEHWAVAFDGVLTIGTQIQEDITACPNTTQLLHALQKCGDTIQVSQLSENVLAVVSERFKAHIDCVPFNELPKSFGDPMQGPVHDGLKMGFAAVMWLANESGEKAWQQAVLLKGNSMVTCNGHVIVEYWHGIPLPFEVLIPKAAAAAIVKCEKPLTAMGVTENSATFYFDDGSFIKTQLFKDAYPAYEPVFNGMTGDPTPIPSDFFTAIDAIAPFAKENHKAVYIRNNKIQSQPTEDRGAVYQISGALIPKGAFNFEYLNGVKAHFSNVVFGEGRLFFRTDRVRGAVMGIRDE